MPRDLRAELAKQPANDPTTWRPEVDDILVGTLIKIDKGVKAGDHGTCDVALVEEDESHELFSVWLSSVVLKAQFDKARPEPGDRIGIRRLESTKNYKRYSVVVEAAAKPTAGEPAVAGSA
jgi:hypothetical protein